MIDTARIAKNTIFLYLRMILVLAANFYAVRILLEVLGVEDYGLFNLIVGFVTLFTFLNGAMMSTVQRFLCYAMGKNGEATSSSLQNQDFNTSTIFSLCFYLFVALAALIFLVSETAGLWFVYHKLNIPPDRFRSAQIVYQLSIVVMLFKTMQIPYTALIISYERMNAFAKISIVEAILTLGAAFAIKWTPGDNLIVYTVLYTVAQAVVCFTYALYCRRHFAEGKIQPVFGRARTPAAPQTALLKHLTSFFSWSILGAVANMLKQQGLNVLLNIFFGVAFNATWAIANKIGMAVNQLVANFQQAFNPQIVKSWADDSKRSCYLLLISTCKFSFFLLWLFVLPIMVCCKFFLTIWLKGEMPPQLAVFVDITVITLLFEALSGPLWMAIQATGKISLYQIQISSMNLLAFLVCLCVLCCGCAAWSVLVVNVVFALICFIYRVGYLVRYLALPFGQFLQQAIIPVLTVIVLSTVIAYVFFIILPQDAYVVVKFLAVFLANAGLVFVFGLSRDDRARVVGKIGKAFRNGS